MDKFIFGIDVSSETSTVSVCYNKIEWRIVE